MTGKAGEQSSETAPDRENTGTAMKGVQQEIPYTAASPLEATAGFRQERDGQSGETGNLPSDRKKRTKRNHNDKQTVKLGFYLTPNTYTALKLHKSMNGIGSHRDSQIINDALTMYLEKELDALKSIDESLPEEERYAKALKMLL